MKLSNPLDIFEEDSDWWKAGKERAVEATRMTPDMEIVDILNKIEDRESWEIMVKVMKLFTPEVRNYIYKQSVKEY